MFWKLNRLKTKPMKSLFKNSLYVILTLGFFSACSDPTKTSLEFMPNMVDSPAVKAHEEPMRLPPVGTVPQGFTPYPYSKEQLELAGAQLKNSLPITREVLKRGQTEYNTFCAVCHGPVGKGNGFIVPKFPIPPNLNSEKIRNWPDGNIFHYITQGGPSLMPSYASQIRPEDRWAIIHYVRAIQRSTNPTEEDLKIWEEKTK